MPRKPGIKHSRVPKKFYIGNFIDDSLNTSNALDKNCWYDLSKTLCRIEFPGCVKNLDKALSMLGGLNNIEKAVSDVRRKLELRFHPENIYNKPCYGINDQNPGILIKVKKKPETTAQTNKDECPYGYEVVGSTDINFTFSRMCDFQYLPLISKSTPETEESDVEYVYENIFPKVLPNMEWFVQKETLEQTIFIQPATFARFDAPQNRLHLHAGEKFESYVRPDVCKSIESSTSGRKRRKRRLGKYTCFVDLTKKQVKLPDQPTTECIQLVKAKGLEKKYKALDKLFQERPIWTKTAIMYHINVSIEQCKILLPSVAYYCHLGPWRMCWIRFGCNPLEDYTTRIYQILDFRLRSSEGLTLKVEVKRTARKPISNFNPAIQTLSQDVNNDRYFVLRPDTLPPARQMMYQYCDILLPEVQEMFARLPRLPTTAKYHGKFGWLPVNFNEQCREIVNKFVCKKVHDQYLIDRVIRSNPGTKDVSAHSSQMLSSLQQGITNRNLVGFGESSSRDVDECSEYGSVINLAEDEETQMDEFVNSIPAHIPQMSDDEDRDQNSDMEIDFEALEEVNNMILGDASNRKMEDDDVGMVTGFLKNL